MAVTLDRQLSRLAPKEPTFKYYPEVGPGRREGNLSIKDQLAFANPASGIIPGSGVFSRTTQPPVIDYMVTEAGDQMITEDGNNIILE